GLGGVHVRRCHLVPAARRRRVRRSAPTRSGASAGGRARRLRLARRRARALWRGDHGRRHGPARRRRHDTSGARQASGRAKPGSPRVQMISFTAEQEEFRRAVARFVDAEVVPDAAAIDESAEFPRKLFTRLGELGYLALRYPEAYGGADADAVTYCLFAEELARGSLSLAAAAAMQSLMGTYFIYKYGDDDLRRRYLVPALRGEKVATFALTEPNAGSDVAGITARAEKAGGRPALRGRDA